MEAEATACAAMDFEVEVIRPKFEPISNKTTTFLLENPQFTLLMNDLASNDKIFVNNRQRDEADLTTEEKLNFLCSIFEKSKPNFLSRFGHLLTDEQAELFERFQNDSADGYEVVFHLKNIARMHSTQKRHKCLRNRRYAALKRLISKDSYFSETEMMKRNPLLYEQLIGQYLSTQEKRVRDHQASAKTFVGVLMQGIEKEQTELKKQQQVEAEDVGEVETSSDSSDEEDLLPKVREEKPVRVLWGEMTSAIPKKTTQTKPENLLITSQERNLLREEFVSSMYENFLDGKDDDFDYNDVDNNDEYDNLEIIANDEEEKYFDSEEPEEVVEEGAKPKEESSEDELDIYMNALNQHPAVCHLSDNFKKL